MAERGEPTAPSTPADLEVVGHAWARADAREKVRGAALYLEDLRVAGMLYGRVCRSRHPHARIRRLDTARAEALPGVAGVVTGAELPFLHGESLVDEPFLARDKVRYLGEAVAVVAAFDQATADEAVQLIDVDYEELPAVLDVEEAVRPGAPLVHEQLATYRRAAGIIPVPSTNICNHFTLARGDVAAAFDACDRVFEDRFSTPMQHHCMLEPHGAICLFTEDGQVTVWTNNDSPYRARRELAEAFGLTLADVRIVSAPNIGGNFGGKGGLKAEAAAAAMAWKLRGRPVRILFTREEEFASSIGRHPSRVRIKTGVMRDGTIVAREVAVYLDSGAYAEKGPTVARFCGVSAAGPYKIPHVKVDVYCVYTNRTMSGAMRGYGGPQACWAYESQMDIIAHALDLDPLALRLKQVYRDGDEHVTGQALASAGVASCLEQLARAMEWPARRRTPNRGVGIACMERAVKTPFGSGAFLKVNEDGSVDLLSSSTEVGQGIDTALRQIAAERLGVPLARIRKAAPDTAFTPFDASTTSSRSIFHMGNAVLLAASDARAQILALAAPRLGAAPADLTIRDGVVQRADGSGPALSIADVLRAAYGSSGTILGRGYFYPETEAELTEYYSRAMAFWLEGAAGAEVEVDRETGRVTVLKLWGAFDAGKAINPVSCQGQIHGGMSMGLGFAVGEEVTFRGGLVLNPSFLGYPVPLAPDVPAIEAIVVEHPHPHGPFGAKGMAETTNVPVPPAIANAIYDAVGVRIRDLPITPERILQALRRQAAAPAVVERAEEAVSSSTTA
jgi:carbon-monoxide dehydrogenase large subunit